VDWLADLQARGTEVRIADPGRGFLDPARLEMMASYEAPSDIDMDGSDLRTTPIYRLKGGPPQRPAGH
ncbi:MAG: hypothetical protein AAF449_17215, partial [Myxococcota bacterium]